MSIPGNWSLELQNGPMACSLLCKFRDRGIDPANFERIYTTKADGLGMGLSVCRTIIEAHKGKLWAETAIPQGAIFQFTLPVTADSAS